MQSPPRGTAKISFYTWQMSRVHDIALGKKVVGNYSAIALRSIPNNY